MLVLVHERSNSIRAYVLLVFLHSYVDAKVRTPCCVVRVRLYMYYSALLVSQYGGSTLRGDRPIGPRLTAQSSLSGLNRVLID